MIKILVTADWHLRADLPRCRLDTDWLQFQAQTIKEIDGIAAAKDCMEIWHLGDLFNTSRVPEEVVTMFLDAYGARRVPWHILAGNHDLWGHAYSEINTTSLGIVLKTVPMLGRIECELYDQIGLSCWPFGLEPKYIKNTHGIWATHQLTFPDEAARPPQAKGHTAQDLLDITDADLVLTGDYHHQFVHYESGTTRGVINPGCTTLQAADMLDYRPSVTILSFERDSDGSLIWGTEIVYLKADQKSLVSTEHLEEVKQRDSRLDILRQKYSIGAHQENKKVSYWDCVARHLPSLSPGAQGIIAKIQDKITKEN